MKRIDKWVTRDGSEWKTEEDALHREMLLNRIDSIESFLPEKDKSTDFANGHGYIQHTRESIKTARNSLIELADEYIGSFMSTYDLKGYAFGRYLDDSNTPLYKLYIRIVLCIDDKTWREYGQPYYANNPEDANQICLNEEF